MADGPHFCLVEQESFHDFCCLIESNGSLNHHVHRWVTLGDSPDGLIKSGYSCRDSGVDIIARWMVEGTMCGFNLRTINWADLQALLELEATIAAIERQKLPAFGL